MIYFSSIFLVGIETKMHEDDDEEKKSVVKEVDYHAHSKQTKKRLRHVQRQVSTYSTFYLNIDIMITVMIIIVIMIIIIIIINIIILLFIMIIIFMMSIIIIIIFTIIYDRWNIMPNYVVINQEKPSKQPLYSPPYS